MVCVFLCERVCVSMQYPLPNAAPVYRCSTCQIPVLDSIYSVLNNVKVKLCHILEPGVFIVCVMGPEIKWTGI